MGNYRASFELNICRTLETLGLVNLWASKSNTESAQRDCDRPSGSSTIRSLDKFSPQLPMSWTRQRLIVDVTP
jgi:hypothetical protein